MKKKTTTKVETPEPEKLVHLKFIFNQIGDQVCTPKIHINIQYASFIRAT